MGVGVGEASDILNAIRRLRAKLQQTILIEHMVLFGSRARGDARAWSDVDIMVVSPAFEGKLAGHRAAPFYLGWDIDIPVEFVCYTPEEFASFKARPGFVRTALEEGQDVSA